MEGYQLIIVTIGGSIAVISLRWLIPLAWRAYVTFDTYLTQKEEMRARRQMDFVVLDLERQRIENNYVLAHVLNVGQTLALPGHVVRGQMLEPGAMATTYSPRYQIEEIRSPQGLLPPASTLQTPKINFDPGILRSIPNDQLLLATGLDESGELDIIDIHNGAHLLLTGRSGQGKSTLAAYLLLTALARNSAKKLSVWLLDMENITSSPFAPYAERHETTIPGIIAALREIAVDVDDRAALIVAGKLKLKDLPNYRLVFIEEALKLILMMNDVQKKEYLALLQNIAVSARKSGIYLMISIQTMRAEGAGKSALAIIRDQCNFKISAALQQNFMINSLEFDDDEILDRVCKEKEPGQFVRMIKGKNALIRVPYFELDELPEIIPEILSHRVKEISPARPGAPTTTERYLRLVESEAETMELPIVSQKESKEEAAIRLWNEGYQSVRSLGARLAELGYTGTSNEPISELIARLNLTKGSSAPGK